MTVDRKPGPSHSPDGQRALRGGAALVVVALFLGGLLLLIDFEKEGPDFYESARVPLSEATEILSQAYGEEEELADKLRAVHSRLDNAIALFGQAEQLDPEDKRQIETLRMRLRALENDDRLLASDPKNLQRAYHELTEQLSALANKLAKPRS